VAKFAREKETYARQVCIRVTAEQDVALEVLRQQMGVATTADAIRQAIDEAILGRQLKSAGRRPRPPGRTAGRARRGKT
jgi:hypothetical protein